MILQTELRPFHRGSTLTAQSASESAAVDERIDESAEEQQQTVWKNQTDTEMFLLLLRGGVFPCQLSGGEGRGHPPLRV